MSRQAEIPLHLCQVLEEEYNNLHGTFDPDADGRVELDGRTVAVGPGWRFDKGHVDFDELRKVVERAEGRKERAEARRRAEQQAREARQTRAGRWLRGRWAALKNWARGPRAMPESLEHELADDLAAHLAYMRPRLLEGLREVERLRGPEEALGRELRALDEAWEEERRRLEDARRKGGGEPQALAEHPGRLALVAELAVRQAERSASERQVIAQLNELIDHHDEEVGFFERRFFERLPMRDETRELLQTGWQEQRPVFKKGDLERFRRLLLEDAFPAVFVRAYDVRLARVLRAMARQKQAALCLSGGGIRSATFSLGVMQGLAGERAEQVDEETGRRPSLLERFDYLSTVSGGGYMGSWLTAWAHRHPRGLYGVVDALSPRDIASKLEPEPEPLRHLRDYSNFLTPRQGLLTADTWTFIAIYVRNLLLNWTVFIPLLLGCLMVPRLLVALVQVEATAWLQTPALVLGTLLGGHVIAYMRLNRPSNSGAVNPAGFWARHRGQSSFLKWCLLPLVAATILLTCYWAWVREHGIRHDETSLYTLVVFGVFGLVVAALVWTLVTARAVHRHWNIHPWQEVVGWRLGRWGRTLLASLAAGALGGLALFAGSYVWEQVRALLGPPPPPSAEPDHLPGFLLFGAALGLVGSGLYLSFVWRSWWKAQKWRAFLQAIPEVLSTVLAAVIGGCILYAVASRVFPDPVADPVKPVEAKQAVEEKTELSKVGGVSLSIVASQPAPTPPPKLEPTTEFYACFAGPLFLLTFLLGVTAFVGLTSSEYAPPLGGRGSGGHDLGPAERFVSWVRSKAASLTLLDEDREWLARFGAWVIIVMIAWMFFTVLVVFGPLAFFPNWKIITPFGTVTSILTVLAARSGKTPANPKLAQSLWQTVILPNLLAFGSLVFVVFLVVVLSFATSALLKWLPTLAGEGGLRETLGGLPLVSYLAGLFPLIPEKTYMQFVPADISSSDAEAFLRVAHYPPFLYLLAVTLGFFAVGRLASRVVDLNKFSLHAGYRNRLMRAYLGASRDRGERKPNPFTGFDPLDNVFMHELRPGLLHEDDFRNLPALVRRLKEAGDEVDEYLRGKLDDKTLYLIESHHPDVTPSQTLKSALFEDINRLLESEEFQNEDAFASVRMDFETAAGPGAAALTKEERRRARHVGNAGSIIAQVGRSNYQIVLNRLYLERHYGREIRPMDYPPPPYRLMHVVNMALNLVGGEKLAWQQRKAESFTTTMLHSGSFRVGYRRSRDYGGKDGISLATAATISGAAVNSNMGYYSVSAAVTFMLTFVNARLGWWLGNPGPAGLDTYYLASPRQAVSPVVDEAFGLTNDRNPYVLLSDGGHFENLGLYEMALRRCHTVVVVDGSADPEGSFDDLGNAVRKIRIDFGIDVEFKSPPFRIYSRAEKDKGKVGGYCALGRIHYENVDGPGAEPGRLIYIKPAFYGADEPRDIYNYAQGNTKFPHDPTFPDQFFDESQFESYRMLGEFIIGELWGDRKRPRGAGAGGLQPGTERGAQAAAPGAGPAEDKFLDFFERVSAYVSGLAPGADRERGTSENGGGGD
ncbi:MAG TPA: patatin-like phospholipase family protein [Pyrinomonadaceae bacterium]|nr:patatin-like phospholipase family protein [Pyrinomonadaceae bacterium]